MAQARALAARPYIAPPVLSRAVLERIDYEAHGKIKFKIDDALFVDGPGAYPVTFFHLGRYFQVPVHMHVLDTAGHSARQLVHAAASLDMPAASPAHEMPPGAGFAGFPFQESRPHDPRQFT